MDVGLRWSCVFCGSLEALLGNIACANTRRSITSPTSRLSLHKPMAISTKGSHEAMFKLTLNIAFLQYASYAVPTTFCTSHTWFVHSITMPEIVSNKEVISSTETATLLPMHVQGVVQVPSHAHLKSLKTNLHVTMSFGGELHILSKHVSSGQIVSMTFPLHNPLTRMCFTLCCLLYFVINKIIFSLRHYVHSTFNQEYSERLGARS